MSRARRRRIFAFTIVVVAVLGLLAAAVLLRVHAAPEVARLLPESNGILYANLKPVRTFTNLGQKPASTAPEYRNFVEQTGFQVERDLDEIALAIHAPQDAQHETRYSEVMVGRFDSAKVGSYLTRMASSRENYQGHEIFLVPYEDRIVRVAVLSVDVVTASNTGDPAQIDHIIDEFRRSSFSAKGPRLLAAYYHKVPFGSVAWLITEVAPPKGLAESFGPIDLIHQLFGGGVVVGSARYNGNVLLRAEDFLSDEESARSRTEQLQNLLSLYKATESQTRPDHPDPEIESALNSLNVEQEKNRVRVNVSVQRGLIEKMFEAPMETELPEQPPAPRPKHGRHKKH
jgi:hypothetical protein